MIGQAIVYLRDEAKRIWLYRRLAALVTALLFCAAAAYILTLHHYYVAWGQIFVNKRTSLAAATEGVSFNPAAYGDPYVIQKTLLNDQNLEQVIRQSDPSTASLSPRQMAKAVERLSARLRVADQGDGFLEISYTDIDPARAHLVVQLLFARFISGNLERGREDLTEAEKFLDQQIAAYATRLADSRARLVTYQQEHTVLIAAGLPPPADLPMPDNRALPAAPRPPPAPRKPSAAAERVVALQARLATLRTTLTDQHPDVIATNHQLAAAMAEQAAEPLELPVIEPSAEVSRSTVFRPRAPRRAVVIPPTIAAEWADLRRSDEALRADYQQLINRRQAVGMSNAVYSAESSKKIQITRQPTVPLLPAGPNRTLFLALAAVVSILGGLAAAYVKAAISGIFVAPRELELAFQLPVVGTVSWEDAWNTRNRKSARQRRLAAPHP